MSASKLAGELSEYWNGYGATTTLADVLRYAYLTFISSPSLSLSLSLSRDPFIDGSSIDLWVH